MSTKFVAWDAISPRVLVGKVESESFGASNVRRIDGTLCRVQSDKLRPATDAEFDDCLHWFNHHGKEGAT